MRLFGRRVRGFPTSGNGASSFHLHWVEVPTCRAVEVSLMVDWEPAVDRLCFWAIQASFSDGSQRTGAAHLGLQWNPRFPRSRAVNWGGYHRGGGILDGTESPLRSSPGDPNTRNLEWEPGVAYRLRIEPAESGWWTGIVRDDRGLEVVVRRLHGGGDRLEAPTVWSEIFTRCDDASVAVTWSDPKFEAGGRRSAPAHYRVNYQAVERGGCSNTSVRLDGNGVRQVTATDRVIPQGAIIPTG